MPTWIEAGIKQGDGLTEVLAEDGKQVLAQGYEVSRTCVCGELSWQERVLVVRSPAYAHTQRQHLQERLNKAQAALLALTPPVGRGKRQITDEAALQRAAEAVLAKHRVRGLLTYTYVRESEQELKFVGRGRGGVNRPQQLLERVRYQITTVTRNEEAIAQFVSTLGWRAYVTNAPQKRLSLSQAVREYRHEYHIERGFGRLKGAPLSLAPMFVKREDQVVGLTRLLSVALRILTLLERNNRHTEELGLLRSGYCRCGICGRSMHVEHPGGKNKLNGGTPTYRCRQREGKEFGTRNRHSVQIHVPYADSVAREKIIEILSDPAMVRAKIAKIREDNKPIIDITSIQATIADFDTQIANLFELAKHATNKETIAKLAKD